MVQPGGFYFRKTLHERLSRLIAAFKAQPVVRIEGDAAQDDGGRHGAGRYGAQASAGQQYQQPPAQQGASTPGAC